MEVEFIACYEAFNLGILLCNFVTGLRILEGIERPLKLYCDNKSTMLYPITRRAHVSQNILILSS